MGSELDRPLGQHRGNDRKPRRPRIRRGVLAGVLAIVVISGGSLYAALRPENVSDGNPTAADDAASKAGTAEESGEDTSGKTAKPAPASSHDAKSATIQSGTSGATLSTTMTSNGVTVTTIGPSRRAGNGPVMIHAGRQIGQDRHMASEPDPRLFKQTKYGKLPIEASDGTRPMDVYARPAGSNGGVRIAIVVGGLGLSQTGTLNAIDLLPQGVTLAFAATGNSLQRWMQAARQAGHEILLQVPMEPFGYPDTNPGRQTLTVAAGKTKDLADLHAAMGRITNYTGVMNYMGGQLMANPDAITPVLRDIAGRGLLFLDDGSSRRSLVEKLAKPLDLPHARATMQLDGDVNGSAVEAKLKELEQVARSQGSAIGVASAFDESVQAIAKWAETAKADGIQIVGVSQLADDPQTDEQEK